MELTSVNYQCPACGGPLRYDGTKGSLVCDYCGSEHDVAEIEAAYAAKEEKEAKKAAEASAEVSERGYTCSSCGASLITDETTAVSTCPYCGNPVVMESKVTGEFAPDLVIPFKLDHASAVTALANHYKGKVLLPKSFKEGNHIEEVQGVYVPFWLYDAKASGKAHFEATRSRTYVSGNDEVTETQHYDVRRGGEAEFHRVPVDGSTKMPDGHMDAIEPFDYDQLVPFSTAYLPGFVANRWDEDAQTCRARAEKRMEKSTIDALQDTVTGYESVNVKTSETSFDWKQEQYAMFPVWMLSTSWEGKNFLFAMNGQTGRLVGDLPVSKPKLVGIAVAVFAVLFAVMWLALGGTEAFDAAGSIAALFGIPVVVSAIVSAVLWNQMKSARTATQADRYLDSSTFHLSLRQDEYRNTTVVRVPKQTDQSR